MIPVPGIVQERLASEFGSAADKLSHFAGGREESDGVIYAYPYLDRRRLLKIMAIPAADQESGLFSLKERLRFMRYLGENKANIAFPQLSPGRELFECFPYEEKLWIGYCMEIAPGKGVSHHGWYPDFFRNWGRTIGRVHRLTISFEPSAKPEDGPFGWRQEWSSFHEWCQDDEVKSKWIEIRDKLVELPTTKDAYGFVHNDPHIWNMVVDGEKITLLDFDVANRHWFANDIAIACQSILIYHSGGMGQPMHHREKLVAFLRHFMEGYSLEYELPALWLNRLDLFIAYRRILLFIVMHGWIGSKPDLHRSWKEMIMSQPQLVGKLSEVFGS